MRGIALILSLLIALCTADLASPYNVTITVSTHQAIVYWNYVQSGGVPNRFEVYIPGFLNTSIPYNASETNYKIEVNYPRPSTFYEVKITATDNTTYSPAEGNFTALPMVLTSGLSIRCGASPTKLDCTWDYVAGSFKITNQTCLKNGYAEYSTDYVATLTFNYLSPNTTYNISVFMYDTEANYLETSTLVTTSPAVPPSITDVIVSSVNETAVSLVWTTVQGTYFVWNYVVYISNITNTTKKVYDGPGTTVVVGELVEGYNYSGIVIANDVGANNAIKNFTFTVIAPPTVPPTFEPSPTPTPTPTAMSTPAPTPKPTPKPTPSPSTFLTCGNGVCDGGLEDCVVCPKDCPGPCNLCGDGTCNKAIGENCTSCTRDCILDCATGCKSDCGANGKCASSICVCNTGFSGDTCTQIIVPTVVTPNQTAPIFTSSPPKSSDSTTSSSASTPPVQFTVAVRLIQERDQNNTIIKSYDLRQGITYQYSETQRSFGSQLTYVATLSNGALVNTTLVLYTTATQQQFAGQSFTTSPQQFKITFTVTQWPFRSLRNSFEVIFDSEVEQIQSGCASTVNTNLDTSGNLRAYKVEYNGATLYGEFLPYGLLDKKPKLLTIGHESSSDTQLLTITSGVFFDELILDPIYSILISENKDTCIQKKKKNNNTIIIIAVVVSVGGATVLLVVGAIVLYPKLRTATQVRKTKL